MDPRGPPPGMPTHLPPYGGAPPVMGVPPAQFTPAFPPPPPPSLPTTLLPPSGLGMTPPASLAPQRDSELHPHLGSLDVALTVGLTNLPPVVPNKVWKQLLLACGKLDMFSRTEGKKVGIFVHSSIEGSLRAARLLHNLSVLDTQIKVKTEAKFVAAAKDYLHQRALLKEEVEELYAKRRDQAPISIPAPPTPPSPIAAPSEPTEPKESNEEKKARMITLVRESYTSHGRVVDEQEGRVGRTFSFEDGFTVVLTNTFSRVEKEPEQGRIAVIADSSTVPKTTLPLPPASTAKPTTQDTDIDPRVAEAVKALGDTPVPFEDAFGVEAVKEDQPEWEREEDAEAYRTVCAVLQVYLADVKAAEEAEKEPPVERDEGRREQDRGREARDREGVRDSRERGERDGRDSSVKEGRERERERERERDNRGRRDRRHTSEERRPRRRRASSDEPREREERRRRRDDDVDKSDKPQEEKGEGEEKEKEKEVEDDKRRRRSDSVEGRRRRRDDDDDDRDRRRRRDDRDEGRRRRDRDHSDDDRRRRRSERDDRSRRHRDDEDRHDRRRRRDGSSERHNDRRRRRSGM